MLTGSLTALILALVEGNAWGWGSTEIVALLAGAAIGLAAFVAIELRVKVPMVEFRFFSDRNFLGAVVVALIISFAMLGVFFFLALYMQDILRYSPLEAGIRFLPSTLMIVAIAPIAGRMADRFGPRWLIVGGLLMIAASLYSFTGIAVDSSYLELLPGLHAARHRHRDDDVADDQRRDERRPGREGRDRLRRALDVPHDRRQPRRRDHRRDLPGRGRHRQLRDRRPAGLRRRASARRWPSPAPSPSPAPCSPR